MLACRYLVMGSPPMSWGTPIENILGEGNTFISGLMVIWKEGVDASPH
jgi:hypothetical protein